MPKATRLTRRPAKLADLPFLLELRLATMSTHLAESGIELSDEEHKARVMYGFDCAEILLDGDEPVGLLKLQRSENQWEIVQFQLCPSRQGRGIGTRLLRELIEQARAEKVALSLSVLRSNPAKSLYESLGFVVTGSDDKEYVMALAS